MTLTCTGERYVVHELLSINDEITSCALEDLHTSECAGKNFQADRETGFWTNIYTESGLSVDAGPIEHRGELVHFPYIVTSLTDILRPVYWLCHKGVRSSLPKDSRLGRYLRRKRHRAPLLKPFSFSRRSRGHRCLHKLIDRSKI